MKNTDEVTQPAAVPDTVPVPPGGASGTSTGLRRRLASRTRWLFAKLSNRRVAAVIDTVLSNDLSYLERDALLDLANAAAAVEQAGIPGVLLEAGTARGGSALVLAAAKSRDRPLHLYDTFGLIPPPSELDGDDVKQRYELIAAGKAEGPGGSRYYGYEEDLLGQVRTLFAEHGYPPEDNAVRFVQGLFQDTMRLSEPVALAHIDSDWYESVTTCLERLVPVLSVGGRVVIDDYGTWSGARTAVEDYFADRRSEFEFEFENRARLHVVRTADQAA